MIIEFKDVIPLPLELEVSKGVSQIFGHNIRFDLSKRNLLVAASGKGKSTLLNILFGLRTDYNGSVSNNADLISKYTNTSWSNFRKEECGYIFQDLRLLPALTALENIQLKNQLANYKSNSEILDMMDRIGISSVKNQQVETLSYGQKQRVAIVRALCQPLKTLLMDEPFSHLDEDNIELCKTLIINELDTQNAGCMLVSLGEDYGIKFDNTYQL
jgi:putative ABC transport system ATP-binding protein